MNQEEQHSRDQMESQVKQILESVVDEVGPMSQEGQLLLKQMEPLVKQILDHSGQNVVKDLKLMSREKELLQEQMKPLVTQILNQPDESAVDELNKLNGEMMEINEKEGSMFLEHCVPVNDLVKASKERDRLTKIVQNSLSVGDSKEAEKNLKKLRTLQLEVQKYMTELMLPSWTFEMPKVDIHSSGQPSSANGWIPGQTEKREQILGYRGNTTTGISTETGEPAAIFQTLRFVIRVDKPNPIELVNSSRVGRKAAIAYLMLPEDQRCAITGVSKKYDPDDAAKLLDLRGVAYDNDKITSKKRQRTVVWVNHKDGKPRVLCRTAYGKALGKKTADDKIEAFIANVREDPNALKTGLVR